MARFKSIALIPAAGMGKRMGASINKQYLELGGLPVVARTISVFEKSPLIDAIYLVIPADEIPYCREHVVEACGFKKVVAIVPGGRERQNSVLNGLNAMRASVKDTDIVLIHDGVRPMVTEEMLSESIKIAGIRGGALVAVPAKDTIKSVHDGIVVETPERGSLWQAQTPQSFRFGIIHAAHLTAEVEGFMGTDDASLVERTGGEVCIVPGDYRNIKITTPEDLILAEAFLESTGKKQTELEKDDFLLKYSHDLKNPLTAAIGAIDIIREGRLGQVNEEQAEYLHSAIGSCNEVVAMIDNLLDIRRFEAGKMSLSISPHNPEEIIRNVAERFSRSAVHEEIGLSINIDAGVPNIRVDRKVLTRIIDNLLVNSFNFTPEGGEIFVTCSYVKKPHAEVAAIPPHLSVPQLFSKVKSFVKIAVRDTGDGITSGAFDEILNRSARSTVDSGRGHGGAGLGLAFCKWGVEGMGGVIWAEGESDEGSEVIILLPCQ